MNDTFLPGSGFDTYESQDKVLMQMDGSTEAAVAVRILQQQGFAVVGAVVRLAPEQAEAAQRANPQATALLSRMFGTQVPGQEPVMPNQPAA